MLVCVSVCSKALEKQFVYLSVISESNACVCECVFQGITEAVFILMQCIE